MAVNLKLVLAEALSELKKSESKERATDTDLDRMSKASSKHHDWPAIKRSYSAAYDNYISALELLNYCRRTGMDHSDQEMITFCADRMKVYMERCEKLRTKESNVLVSVREADNSQLEDSYLKQGYTWGELLFAHQRTSPIKGNTPIEYQHTLKDGAYYLQVKNYDDYTVAAPQIKVQLLVKGRAGQSLKQQKIIPALTCWGKNIGVVSSSEVMIRVVSDGMVRTSQVEVTLRELIPPADTLQLKDQLSSNTLDTSWVDSLPALPNAVPNATTGGATGSTGVAGSVLPPPAMDMPELPPPDMNNFGFGLTMPESAPGYHPADQQQCFGMPPIPQGQNYQDPGALGPYPPQQSGQPTHYTPPQQDGGMPLSDPRGSEGPRGPSISPGDAVMGSSAYPLSQEQQGSTELLGSLAVPGGAVGSSSPLMQGQNSTSSEVGSVGVDDLANLQVPYNANRASNTGNNGKAAGPTPYFGNPMYQTDVPPPVYGDTPPPASSSTTNGSAGGNRERPAKLVLPPQIQKPGATPAERLTRVKQYMDYYLAASAGEKAMAQAMTNPEKYFTHLTSCNPQTKQLAEKITLLPEPTELGMDDLDDMDLGDMDLDMADLEAGNF